MRQVMRHVVDRAVRFWAILMALVLIAGLSSGSAFMLAANAATATSVAPGACGRVLLAGSAWLGGAGVDVKSNGPDQGGGTSCGGKDTKNTVDGIQTGLEWQCVELVNRRQLCRADHEWQRSAGQPERR